MFTNRTFLGASLVTQQVKNPPTMQETPVGFLGQEDPLEKRQTTHSSILGFPVAQTVKNPPAMGETELGRSIPGLGRSPGEGSSYPLQYPGLENLYSPWGHMTAWLQPLSLFRTFLGLALSMMYVNWVTLCSVLCWVAQSSPSLCNCMDCSPPVPSVQGDSPGKTTGVGCHALPKRIFTTRDWSQVSHFAGRFFTVWATCGAQEYWSG